MESTDGGKTFAKTICGDSDFYPTTTREAWQVGTNGVTGDAALRPGPQSVTTINNEELRRAPAGLADVRVRRAQVLSGGTVAARATTGRVRTHGDDREPRPRASSGAARVCTGTLVLRLGRVCRPADADRRVDERPETDRPADEQRTTEILVRRFNGGTRFNDHGAWGPFIDVGPGKESHLAGLPDGKKGIHLLYKVRRYRVDVAVHHPAVERQGAALRPNRLR